MQLNWPILFVVIVAVIILLVLIIRENRKDERDLTDQLNNDYKRDDEDEDTDIR